MDDIFYGNINPADDLTSHLPQSLQTMLEIEQRAQAKFDRIMQDIKEGKYTLEDVKRKRGLI